MTTASAASDNGSLPIYSGTYREKLNAVQMESFDDDAERISQFRLRRRLAGTDGSSLQLAMSGKVTRNASGEVVVDRYGAPDGRGDPEARPEPRTAAITRSPIRCLGSRR